MPARALQMHIFVHEQRNEYDTSVELLLKLMASGEVTDPQEFIFLLGRLKAIFKKTIDCGQIKSPAKGA